LEELKRLGGEVQYFAADISKENEIERLVNFIDHAWGKLDCIIHAAGVLLSEDDIEKTCQAKIAGTLLLDRLVQRYSVRKVVLFSSLSSVLGMPTAPAYALANAFCNEWLSKQDNSIYHTILWPHWQSTGMSNQSSPEVVAFEHWMKQVQGLTPL